MLISLPATQLLFGGVLILVSIALDILKAELQSDQAKSDQGKMAAVVRVIGVFIAVSGLLAFMFS